MTIDWDKWQAIERRHNQLKADVDFCKERLDLATANHRNAEISLLRAIDSGGLFRRVDRAQWLRDARENPEDCLSRHIGQPVESILRQFVETRKAKEAAASTHASAEAAFLEHGRSYHPLRNWVREQQSMGLLA